MFLAEDSLEPLRPRRRRGLVAIAILLVVALGVAATTWYGSAPLALGVPALPLPVPGANAPAAAPGDVQARIVGSDPADWDPALQGDYGSATTIAQVFESLTSIDAAGVVQPALATSWSVEDGGKRVVFTLRPGIAFSDGSPITAADVVASWLRLLDPARPSPLASLLSDVVGARERLAGTGSADQVGLRADGDKVTVTFRRPAAYFPSVAATSSLAVVSPADAFNGPNLPANLVVSGAYLPVEQTSAGIRLEANSHYWAGPPPLSVIEIVTDLGGLSVVEAFDQGLIDYSQLGSFDAGWIRYDKALGPQLVRQTQLAVDYYGFDTTKPPFADPRVRQAFAEAVDWHRIVQLSTPDATVATSLLPPGMPGRSQTDFTPVHDPDAARALLTAAGFPGGAGFPEVALVSQGYPYDEAIVAQLSSVLGVHVRLETMAPDEYFARLAAPDRPAFWDLSWVADYPAPQDFLGLLLETGSTSNYGGWSDPAYDAALDTAAATSDPAAQTAAYDAAQALLQGEVPLVPVAYHDTWALSRTGLTGTGTSGMGILRFAGLAWVGK
ncbi:MAG: peptide ABC transporter substrate-binding protein [Candidatus Limnocylindrales bacterium]